MLTILLLLMMMWQGSPHGGGGRQQCHGNLFQNSDITLTTKEFVSYKILVPILKQQVQKRKNKEIGEERLQKAYLQQQRSQTAKTNVVFLFLPVLLFYFCSCCCSSASSPLCFLLQLT
jgi:hypothetical protein